MILVITTASLYNNVLFNELDNLLKSATFFSKREFSLNSTKILVKEILDILH